MNLKGRDFLKLLDFSSEEIRYLLDTAKKFKELKKNKQEHTWKRTNTETLAHYSSK